MPVDSVAKDNYRFVAGEIDLESLTPEQREALKDYARGLYESAFGAPGASVVVPTDDGD